MHEGQHFLLEYAFSSCGPNHRDGDQGMIIAKQPEGDELCCCRICAASAMAVLRRLQRLN
ncbi:hypothetical protein ULF88_01180 [Halopseudomonas pachastrellae]|nr:hypothetical protein [Halopseudomonas pachastrellae]